MSLKRGWAKLSGDEGTLVSLAHPRGWACHWSPQAPSIIHDSEGSSAAAGSPGGTVATGTGLVTAEWESSLDQERTELGPWTKLSLAEPQFT